jgi:hypothetical protein
MDIHHVPLRFGGCKSLRDFTRISQIHATSPLDLQGLDLTSRLRTLAISVLKLKTPLQLSQSSRSIDKCPPIDQRLSALRLSALQKSQVSNLAPSGLLSDKSVGADTN